MQAIVTKYAFDTFDLEDWDEDAKENLRAACRRDGNALWPGWFLDAYTSNMDPLCELVIIDDDGKVIYNGEL